MERGKMKAYIAKPNTWFKAGTKCKLVSDCESAGGIFRGIRVCSHPLSENRKEGEEYEDEELCPWDEFEVKEVCNWCGGKGSEQLDGGSNLVPCHLCGGTGKSIGGRGK